MGDENQEQVTKFEERWKKIEDDVNIYLNSIGATSKTPSNIVDVVNIAPDVLKRLSHEECGEYSYTLAQYAYFLQQQYNFHKSKIEWVEDNLNYITANYGSYNGYVSKDTKLDNINKQAKNHPNIKILLDVLSKAKIITNNLEALSFKINKMGEAMMHLQQTKRRLNG